MSIYTNFRSIQVLNNISNSRKGYISDKENNEITKAEVLAKLKGVKEQINIKKEKYDNRYGFLDWLLIRLGVIKK